MNAYNFFVIDKWCLEHTNATNFPSVQMDLLRKLQIPIPPLEIQQKIVDILDKFNTLTTSITQGLLREIELRNKQYEYYRDQLLTFQELKNQNPSNSEVE